MRERDPDRLLADVLLFEKAARVQREPYFRNEVVRETELGVEVWPQLNTVRLGPRFVIRHGEAPSS